MSSQSDDEFVGSALSAYDESHVYSRTRDDIDHVKWLDLPWRNAKGRPERLRVPTDTYLMVTKVINELPDVYASQADFGRDAYHHRAVYWLQHNRYSDPTSRAVRLQLAKVQADMALANLKYKQDLHGTLETAARMCESIEDRAILKMEILKVAENFEDDPEWHDRFMSLLRYL